MTSGNLPHLDKQINSPETSLKLNMVSGDIFSLDDTSNNNLSPALYPTKKRNKMIQPYSTI